MASSLSRTATSRFLACLVMLSSTPLLADSGVRAVWVVCDPATNEVEVRLFILWNEDLEAYLKRYPSGFSDVGPKSTKVFISGAGAYSRNCDIDGRRVEIAIDNQDTLTLAENGHSVATRAIDYVWFASGQDYRLKSSDLGQWQECTGAIDGAVGHALECRGLTNAKTTNQEDIEAFWK